MLEFRNSALRFRFLNLESIHTSVGSRDQEHDQQPHVADEPLPLHDSDDTGDQDMLFDSGKEPDDVQDLSQLLNQVLNTSKHPNATSSICSPCVQVLSACNG